MDDRVILHCDCNSFYASVELLHHPEFRQLPVAVAGSSDERHGIILAKNEHAKKYHVNTAETVWQAKRKCPGLILLPPHHREYQVYSQKINEIYEQYTDCVEPFGIDESWLDVTGSWQLFGATPYETANKIRRRIKEETGLTISIGISFNKVFAKLGSDYKKPDAITEITRENYKSILWPLPTGALLFVGGKTRQTLSGLGIRTIGQLAQAEEPLLRQALGKQGAMLRRYAAGEDDEPVVPSGSREPVKSVGNGLTFKRNLMGHQDLRVAVDSLADEVAGRLRRKKLYAQSLQVLVKDPDFKSISRQRPLPLATNLAFDLSREAMELIRAHWDMAKPIRMLTLTAQQLTELPFAPQLSLFDTEADGRAKTEQLEHSIDKIRSKYGKSTILKAAALHNTIGVEDEARPEEDERKE